MSDDFTLIAGMKPGRPIGLAVVGIQETTLHRVTSTPDELALGRMYGHGSSTADNR